MLSIYLGETSVGFNQPIKLIYIVGSGHSGSTLLDLLLGSHSDIESDGEIFSLPEFFASTSERPVAKRLCTCGSHVEACAYWQNIRKQLDSSGEAIDLEINTNNQKDFEARNFKLIATILETSGKSVFCDSSKAFSRLKRFLKSALFNVTIVHLIRDGRAVSFSGQKKAARVAGKPECWHQYQDVYFKKLRSWKRYNLKIHRRLKSEPGYIYLRYEDLVANPRAKLTEILDQLKLPFEDQQLQFWQVGHHNLSGNRWRRQMNLEMSHSIQRDINYLYKIPQQQWWLSNLYAFSELRKFGYSLIRE